MSRNAFLGLLATIRHDLDKNEEMARRSSKEPVFPYLQLCIALRYLSGGSYLDIADVYKVPSIPPSHLHQPRNHDICRSMNQQ
jgi:hypothetical protein